MIIVDGISYDVPINSLTRKTEFLDSYADRTENGDLKRKLIGVYYNYELKISPTKNTAAYNAFWDKITEATEFHQVTIPFVNYSFTAYISNVSDSLKKVNGNELIWDGLTVSFIAKSPARR